MGAHAARRPAPPESLTAAGRAVYERRLVISDRDELPHAFPDTPHLWKENVWLSVVDAAAGIFGVNHISLTNRGHGRFCALYQIDGRPDHFCNKHPIPGDRPLEQVSDGRLTYSVIRPQHEVRVTFEGPRYRFDLTYEGRFPIFDYDDCPGGSPFRGMHERMSFAHYEQAMACRGTFELTAGPRRGERRKIDCLAHRDHSWGVRIEGWSEAAAARSRRRHGHFWPTLAFPHMQLAAFGILDVEPRTKSGGFAASPDGVEPLTAEATAELEADGVTARAFRYRFTLARGKTLTVRTGRKLGHVMLWLRGENDVESVYDCHEPFFEVEVEESGERGYGTCEYGIIPPCRWRL